ncbi:haloacid dehalogenase-like hydrolase [Actinomycetospora endophytica]|uniref:Haloacid dehalogenase-like hydrolase n=1 Tax=Actinomycetospora endophytica TaxID=2291215 RepID=A0ABS8PL26_9PSEU|nr:HAD family hydrolase [Actinomycetospora endophytica]MCD2198101.1 haloacid dehalogenase-like hydrolase [Actinomycetospora endophytica]
MPGLDSWRDGPARRAIEDFVRRTTDPSSPVLIPPEERVVVTDNDGTLWCEKPMPIQLDFTVRRLAALAHADPTLRGTEPYRAAHEGDTRWFGAAMVKHYRGDDADLGLLKKALTSAFGAVAVEEYDRSVREFFRAAQHPTLGRPYRTCGFAPMVDLLTYLAAHGFTVYIASGGDRDFMRPVAGGLYGVPPERVIGSALGLEYRDTRLLYRPEMDFFDDGPEKPVRIWSRIGRRPVISIGNANGDLPMLEFSDGGGHPALRLVVRHDDGEREFDDSSGAEDLLARAADEDWTVVSMRRDWDRVFAGAGS